MQGFKIISPSGFGGDAIKVKIKDGCRRPHLSADRNHFRADTTRLLGEQLRQVLKTPTSGLGGNAITRKRFTDERTDGGWYTKNRNRAAESYPGC